MSERPTTLDELLAHYREMARLHHERWNDGDQSQSRRDAGLAMSTAYSGAVDELDHVMSLRRGTDASLLRVLETAKGLEDVEYEAQEAGVDAEVFWAQRMTLLRAALAEHERKDAG